MIFYSYILRCKIYFYLEDDSIQVIEPKLQNSGIPQGKFILRTFQMHSLQSLSMKSKFEVPNMSLTAIFVSVVSLTSVNLLIL